MFGRLTISLALGLIVGLQRERSGSPLAGFRTFPLVTLFGAVSGLLSLRYGGWIIAAGIVALAPVLVVRQTQRPDEAPGLTTEVSAFVMFVVGAFCITGPLGVAAAIGGTVAVLLHLKTELHSVARRLEDPDFKAIMQFVLITLVILPILPNREYGPYHVLNPFKVWLMVVLIVGISLVAYIIYKFFGQRAGTLVGGILGGLISSTATTISYARRSALAPESSSNAALVIMIASSILFLRMLALIGATNAAFLSSAAVPIGSMFAFSAIVSLIYGRFARSAPGTLPNRENPSELKAALAFGLLYAVIQLATVAAKERFGSQGLFVVAVISGLTDMDAITLSLSTMVLHKEVDATSGARLVLVAALSNLLFKGAAVAVLGSRKLLARILLLFGLCLLAGIIIIALSR